MGGGQILCGCGALSVGPGWSHRSLGVVASTRHLRVRRIEVEMLCVLAYGKLTRKVPSYA